MRRERETTNKTDLLYKVMNIKMGVEKKKRGVHFAIF